MAFDISTLTAEQQLQIVYAGYYNRAAEPDGFDFWLGNLEENLNGDDDGVPGLSLEEIATEFFNQVETREVYNLSDDVTSTADLPSAATFLFNVYQNLFGRVPDAAGVQFWSGVLEDGDLPVGEIILEIVKGASAADQQALLNKVEVGLDWHDAAKEEGVLSVDPVNPDPNYDAAVAALANNDDDGRRDWDDNVVRDESGDPVFDEDGNLVLTDDPSATVESAKQQTNVFFNDAPVASDDAVSTDEDNDVDGDVGNNTSDPEGDTLIHTVEGGDGPANGTVIMNADGTYTYTPNDDFNGTDSFTYTVSDGIESDTATVTVTVNAVNDAPVALAGAVATTEDAAVSGSVSSTDVDGGAPNYSLNTGPADGFATVNPNGSFTYNPNGKFESLNDGDSATDTFTYSVSDGNGGTDTETVTVTVNGVDDAPVAPDVSGPVDEDASLSGTLAATDVDNDDTAITYQVNTAVAGFALNSDGTWTFDASNAAYQSLAEGETQVVSTSYTATSNGKTDTGAITITVTGTNDAPVASASTTTTAEDNAVSGSVSANDVDNDDSNLSYAATNGSNGTVSMNADGTYTYTPADDFNGTDTFTYTATDPEGATDTETVTVTVNPVDDAPVAQDESASVDEDASILDGKLDADDIDNDNSNITFALNAAAPAGLDLSPDGSYTFNASVPTYQSLAEGEIQVVTAGYTATSNGKTDTGTITVTVTGTNDAPVASSGALSTPEDTPVSGILQATDVDGDTLTYSLNTGASDGDVTVNQNGSFTYNPDAFFNGIDSFTYTVSDGKGGFDTATVNIGVTEVDDVLTTDIDIIPGGQGDDIIIGNENTLNAGDNIRGAEGDDTLIINVNLGSDEQITLAGFEADVETFQTTIDGEDLSPKDISSVTFDMSSSEITGNTFVNINSTQDVTYDRVNMTAGGTNGDDNNDGLPDDLFSIELRNVTNNANTTVTTRPGQVTGTTDAAAILLTNLDNNAHIGELNFYGNPGMTDDSGIEDFNLSTEGSPLPVFLNDLNTPGDGAAGGVRKTVNIDADIELTIGDLENPGDADAIAIDATINGGISGFNNPLSADVTHVDATDSTADVNLSVAAANEGTTVLGGDGNDIFVGGAFGDMMSGGAGNDALAGGNGNDMLYGDAGNDSLFGGAGNDSLFGGEGNDYGNTGTLEEGAGTEYVEMGSGNDTVDTRGEFLVGRAPNGSLAQNTSVNTDDVDQFDGGDGLDVLNIHGPNVTPAETDGLNDVVKFETINLINGTFDFTIGNGSKFENDHDTRVDAGGNDGSTTIDGTNSGADVDVDATTLDEAITLIGGDGDDNLRGGRGDDLIIGDGDLSGDGGTDILEGGRGDDTFRMGEAQLDISDIIDGDQGSDTIEVVNRSNGTTATLGAGIGGIETLKVIDDAASNGHSFDLVFDDFNNEDNVDLNHDFINGDQADAVLHVDASELDLGEELNLDMSGNNFDEDIKATGGAGDDTFNFGVWFDGDDTIDGGADSGNSDTLIVDIAMLGGLNDDDFANTTNIEILKLVDPLSTGATVNLGALAAAAGIKTVDASALTENGTIINAVNFPNDLRVIDSDANLDIRTGVGNDTIELAGGTDTLSTGDGDDVIEIDDGSLDASDEIDGGAGNDSVEFQNMDDANLGGIDAVVDLDNVIGIENYTFAGNGDIPNVSNDADAHTLTFQAGNVGTVTDIHVDGSNVTDTRDSLEVVIGGSDPDSGLPDVDVDFRFTIDGTAGDDRLYKANNGLNNDIEFNGGAGSDTISIFGDDLGSTTTIDGGTGTDWLSQTGGVWTDDSFINVTSVEGLTAESPLVATLGANAAAAGIDRILGTSLNEDVTLDAAFTNNIRVDLSAGGDDTINGAASSGTVTFFGESQSNDITADDSLTGGGGANDSILLDFNGTGTADLSNVNGVETVNITETASGVFTLLLGATSNDNVNNRLTINENSAYDDFFEEGGNPWDGEKFILDGSNYNGEIHLNGQDSGLGAVGDITTSTTGAFDDIINAGAGNDVVRTNAGNDVVNGESGDDYILSGTGNDDVDGGSGDDTITGGLGNDELTGGDGADDFRYVTVAESRGLTRDTITDFDTAEGDQITIETSLIFAAVNAANSPVDLGIPDNIGLDDPNTGIGFNFAGNTDNFSDAQGAISLTGKDGYADFVLERNAGPNGESKLWIDVNDDGVLNGLDIQIFLEDVTSLDGDELLMIDTIAPTVSSVSLGIAEKLFSDDIEGPFDETQPGVVVDGTYGGGDTTIEGQMDGTDNDGTPVTYEVTSGGSSTKNTVAGVTTETVVGTYGTLTLVLNGANAGAYTYTAGATGPQQDAIEALDDATGPLHLPLPPVQDQFDVTVTDDVGLTATTTFTVNVTGADDQPTLADPIDAVITEDGPLATGFTVAPADSLTGTLDGDDADASDNLVYGIDGGTLNDNGTPGDTSDDFVTQAGSYGTLRVEADGLLDEGDYTYTPDADAIETLAFGQTETDTFTVTVTDGDDGLVTQTYSVILTGANDAPVISLEGSGLNEDFASATLTETNNPDLPLNAADTLTVRDVDILDTVTNTVALDGFTGTGLNAAQVTVLGGLDLDSMMNVTPGPLAAEVGDQSNIVWAFNTTPDNFNFLGEGDTVTITYTVTSEDNHGGTDTQDVTITIIGTNDEPVIDGATNPGSPVVEDQNAAAQDIGPETGTITISDADIGDPMTLTVTGDATATYSDGDISDPLSALNNADTAGGSPDSIDVSALVAAGAISFSATPATSSGGQQVWDWVYDPAAAADLDWLRENETLTITYDAQVNDGTITVGTQPLVITINGTNDDVAVNTDSGTTDVVELLDASTQVVNADGTLTIEDQDVGDTITYTVAANVTPIVWSVGAIPGGIDTSPLTALGNLVVNSGATDLSNGETFDTDYVYTSGAAELDWLDGGETLTLNFNVQVDDGFSTTTETVTITINGTHDDPIALDDSGTTDQDTVLTGEPSVLDNDDPVDITDNLTVAKVTGVDVPFGGLNINSTAGGILSMQQDGTWEFDPNGAYDDLDDGEIAVENIELTITNDEGVTTTSNLQIIIEGINDAPLALNDSGLVVNEDDLVSSPSVFSVLDNDSDVDDEPISITQIDGVNYTFGDTVTLSSGAEVVMASDGTFDYDPNGAWEFLDAGDIGLDTFTYTISDGDLTDTATVSVTVVGEFDAGAPFVSNTPPPVDDDAEEADDNSADETNNETTTMSGSVEFTDPQPSDVLTYSIINETNILGTISPTPSFSVGNSVMDVAWEVDVTDSEMNFLGEGQNLFGSFDIVANSSGGGAAVHTVNVTYIGANDAPVGVDDIGATDADTVLNVLADGILGNDTDEDLIDVLTVSEVDGGGGANVGNATAGDNAGLFTINGDGSYTFDPNGEFASLADGVTDTTSISYTVFDGTDTDTATVTVTVTGVNDAPVAEDDVYDVNEDSGVSQILPGVLANDSDPDGDSLTVTAINGSMTAVGNFVPVVGGGLINVAADGSFQFDTNGEFEYLDTGDSEVLTFDYQITDGNGEFDTATAEITVQGANDAPVNSVPGPVTTDEDTSFAFTGSNLVTVADVDDGEVLTTTLNVTNGIVNVSAGGGATLGGSSTAFTINGTVAEVNAALAGLTFTPDAGFDGAAAIEVVTDDGDATDTDTIDITVDDVPITFDITFIGSNNGSDGDNFVGNDAFSYHLIGNNGPDTLTGADQDDLIEGGNQPDVLSGEEGDDTIDGGQGNDTITGGDGADVLSGGQGDDTFVFDGDIDPFGGNPGGNIIPSDDKGNTITDFELGSDLIDFVTNGADGDGVTLGNFASVGINGASTTATSGFNFVFDDSGDGSTADSLSTADVEAFLADVDGANSGNQSFNFAGSGDAVYVAVTDGTDLGIFGMSDFGGGGGMPPAAAELELIVKLTGVTSISAGDLVDFS